MSPQKEKGPHVRMSLYLRPPELAAKLKALALIEGKPAAELMNAAIAQYVEQREKKHGAALKAVLKAQKKE